MGKVIDKPCRNCGYDLTGLEIQGRCPECGGYYDGWSGEGLGGGLMDKHERGDFVMGVMKVAGLVVVALLILGLGALASWNVGKPGSLILTGVVSLILLTGAVVSGLSLRRR